MGPLLGPQEIAVHGPEPGPAELSREKEASEVRVSIWESHPPPDSKAGGRGEVGRRLLSNKPSDW